jgi:hypothetical protein
MCYANTKGHAEGTAFTNEHFPSLHEAFHRHPNADKFFGVIETSG